MKHAVTIYASPAVIVLHPNLRSSINIGHNDPPPGSTAAAPASVGHNGVLPPENLLTNMSFLDSFRRRKGTAQADPVITDDRSEVSDGSLHYVAEKAGNDSGLSYQEASGAPVEAQSPLGYEVGAVTIIFLNVSKMIGTGVFSTRGFHGPFQSFPSLY